MKKAVSIAIFYFVSLTVLSNPYDNPDTLFVARDGTCQFRNIDDAIEVCRAFTDYHKVIFVKKGTYKEKLIVPAWLTNIEICGEDRDNTIITYDDHANIVMSPINSLQNTAGKKLTTFRTYTLKIEGNNITLKNITVENNAKRLGQAVALHTQGTRLCFINCRFLGHQDTIYTGGIETNLYFKDCYIEGTTDFIFGPSTAWFENCTIRNRHNSYITAASTPKDVKYGYIFNHCKVIADDNITKCFLGRPWRPYGYTLFMNCELGAHILPVGWHNWGKESNEQTARYYEYNNTDAFGTKVDTSKRAAWSKQLSKKEATTITPENVFGKDLSWIME